jgi:D-alanyl-D-alanine-carboxypeptidase/D-alanyl-D-alanine-endopeptidase
LPFLPSPAEAEDFTNAIHAYLEQCVHAEIPAGCIVIGLVDEHGTQIVSCGTPDNGTDQEADGDTVFALNSTTGTFSYLVVQIMVDRGLMKLDDPVAKYLPPSVRVPTRNGKHITLQHLLWETSGLPDFHDFLDPKRAENPLTEFTVEQMDAFVSGSQLANDPGAKHVHGAVDKGLLGQAVEFTAGTNFESLLVERICGPLKMDSTRFNLTPELKSRRAVAHTQLGYTVPIVERGALFPLAGLYSTANDMLKFLAALGVDRFNLAALNAVTKDGKLISTGGGMFGSRSIACYDRAHHRGVVLLSTSTDLRVDFCELLLASQWRSDRRPVPGKLSHDAYDAYVGQYQPTSGITSGKSGAEGTNVQASIGIRRQGNRLFAQVLEPNSSATADWMPPIAAELLPQSEDRFFERLSARPVMFTQGNDGKVTGLRVSYQGKSFIYKKISNQPPKPPEPNKPLVAIKLDPKTLDAFVGDYEFPSDKPSLPKPKIAIRREGDQLTGQVWGTKAIKGAFDIFPASDTNFFLKIDGTQLLFVKNDRGQITALIHRSARPGVPDSPQAKKLPGSGK